MWAMPHPGGLAADQGLLIIPAGGSRGTGGLPRSMSRPRPRCRRAPEDKEESHRCPGLHFRPKDGGSPSVFVCVHVGPVSSTGGVDPTLVLPCSTLGGNALRGVGCLMLGGGCNAEFPL
jgi:hypothetical protein